ncbi:uncharacterized protein Bfra_009498 [Botrytis fragariae]|uniref:Uncharacterized protein n=1 Tax=Botrytis fragariae TaxID=1964551 RepID=A0A8H6EFZ9_9HELO|nr:uncharacterized protein Bfra_009498 [Botrytis fragariae]KAF5870944.1 hypothetical protein Bfra_009498 [Botrytis fragariae]
MYLRSPCCIPYKYGRELSWEILLDKLEAGSDFSSGFEDILQEREENIIKFQSIDGRVCSCCGEVGMSYATEDERTLALYDLCRDRPRQVAKEREAGVEDSMFSCLFNGVLLIVEELFGLDNIKSDPNHSKQEAK